MVPQVLGRYEVIRPIASGGMATVFLGRALGVGGFQRLVAIKVMHPQFAQEAEFVSMFMDEARLAASIRHPNVVGTLDIEQGPEGLFLVMEFVEGVALNVLLRVAKQHGRRLPLPVVLRVFLDLLAGLHAAHELTSPEGAPLLLVHRDVSPHNVLVGTDGISRITDFGVARAEARLVSTREGSVKGKLPYMPPEQLRGLKIDRRADLYSAGVCLWEMLTGERMIQGDDPGAVMAAVLQGTPRSPRELDPGLPIHIVQVCVQSLQPVDYRFRTAAEFADALEAAAAADGVPIANTRTVGALAKAAAPPMDPIPAAPASHPGEGSGSMARYTGGRTPVSHGSMPSISSSASRINQSASVQTPVALQSGVSPGAFSNGTLPPVSGPMGQSITNTATAASVAGPMPTRRWPQFLLFGCALVGAAAGAAWFAARSAANNANPSGVAAQPSASETAAPAQNAPPPSTSEPTASAVASAAPPETASAAVATKAPPKSGNRPSPRPAAPQPAAAPQQPQSPRSFHPDTP